MRSTPAESRRAYARTRKSACTPSSIDRSSGAAAAFVAQPISVTQIGFGWPWL